MRKSIAYYLTMTLVFLSCSVTGIWGASFASAEAQSEIKASNFLAIERAKEYRIVPEEVFFDLSKTITFSEFNQIIRAILMSSDPGKIAEWDAYSVNANTSKSPMKYADIYAFVYYAACLLGYGTTPSGNWMYIYDHGHKTNWTWTTSSLFPDATKSSPFKDIIDRAEPVGWDYYTAGYFWCMGQFSRVDSEPILDVADSILSTPLSRQDGIAIATRFYESILQPATSEDSADAEVLLAQAQAWKADFLGRTVSVTNTNEGATYYVSNSGNDKNNGKSPEKAWATLKKAFKAKLKPGDTILLERGSTWYIEPSKKRNLTSSAFELKNGVTLSAYGEGSRPIVRGDVIGASDPENWQLWLDEGGKKVWTYTKMLRDCNVIVFNQGQSYAYTAMPFWNGNEYCNADGTPFSVEQALNQDLMFCSLVELKSNSDAMDIGNSTCSGPLYLRCDAGNPADVYDDVSIPQTPCGFILKSNSTISGLDLRYFTCISVTMDSYDEDTGMTLKDCEVSWCGGLINGYQSADGVAEGVTAQYRAGGAIQCSGSKLMIANNYIHDCGPMTCIMSIHGDKPKLYTYNDTKITNNFIERCGTAFHWAGLSKMDNVESDGYLSNIEFSHNYVYYSGSGWIKHMVDMMKGNYQLFLSAIENMMGAVNNDGIKITDNIFYLSSLSLIQYSDHLWESEDSANLRPVFAGNIYAQHQYGWLAEWNAALFALSQEAIINEFGDMTGKVVTIY